MKQTTVEDCFIEIRNGANIKQGIIEGGYPITRIETLSEDKFNRDRMGYAGINDKSRYIDFVLEDGDLLMSHINSPKYLGRTVMYCSKENEIIIHGMNLLRLKCKKEVIKPGYAELMFYSPYVRAQIGRITKKSVNQASFSVSDLKKIKVGVPNIDKQDLIVWKSDKIKDVIKKRRQQLEELDTLVKSRFVEMFGDLKLNEKHWAILSFNNFAKIDTNMIHNFTEHEDYPHIGIDSIEKETGKLTGYRTVIADGVISGKYLFGPEHIIYSKIRPNLNKVAIPNFVGVCSADAYPILVKKDVCNREFLAFTMRSKFFLDYILAFSSRTNLPKVNQKQVEGFKCPIPKMEFQNQFAAFVHQVDKSKIAVQKSLEETQTLFDSLMQQYFG